MKLERFKQFLNTDLNEAVTKVSSKISLSTKKLIRKLQKQMGFRFYRLAGLDRFSKQGRKMIGARYFVGDTLKSVRFNYGRSGIESIDVWDGTTVEPKITITVSNVDLMVHYDKIADLIKLPRIQQIEVLSEDVGMIYAVKGKAEHDMDPDIKIANKIVTSHIDGDILFKDLQELTRSVVKGQTPALLVTGLPGVGKSKAVENVVKRGKPAKDRKIVSGVASPFGLYRFLYEYRGRNKLIVFDDSDSVISDSNAKTALKAALDSGGPRTISWISRNTISPSDITDEDLAQGKLPSSFRFQGSIIFISNLRKNQIDQALVDRSLTIDIVMSTDDIITRIKNNIKQIQPKVDLATKQEVLDFMDNNRHSLSGVLNMRTFVKGVKIKMTGSRRWKDLIIRYA